VETVLDMSTEEAGKAAKVIGMTKVIRGQVFIR